MCHRNKCTLPLELPPAITCLLEGWKQFLEHTDPRCSPPSRIAVLTAVLAAAPGGCEEDPDEDTDDVDGNVYTSRRRGCSKEPSRKEEKEVPSRVGSKEGFRVLSHRPVWLL